MNKQDEEERENKGKRTSVMRQLEAMNKEMIRKKDGVVPPWVERPVGDAVFGLVIFLNAAFIGVDLEVSKSGGHNWGMWAVESLFLVAFLAEIGIRIRAKMPNPMRYFDGWGIFDTTVTLLGVADTWVLTLALGTSNENPMSSFTVLRVFRLMRLARLVRVLRMFSELVILIETMRNSLRAVGWMALLLAMLLYTGSIVTVLLMGDNVDKNEDVDQFYGSMFKAVFWHFAMVTLENWPDMASTAMEQSSPAWGFYFVFMIILANFCIVNLMVGVIVERIIHATIEQTETFDSFAAEMEVFRETLYTLFTQADLDSSGDVSAEEVHTLLGKPQTQQILECFDINLSIPPTFIDKILDLHRTGGCNFQQFFNTCVRLYGSSRNTHSLFLQHDLSECQRDVDQRMERIDGLLKSLDALLVAREARLAREAVEQDAPKASVSLEEKVETLHARLDRFEQMHTNLLVKLQSLMEEARSALPAELVVITDSKVPWPSRGSGQLDRDPVLPTDCKVADRSIPEVPVSLRSASRIGTPPPSAVY